MSTTVRGLSPILDGYLAELDAATAHLPADEQFEIRSSIEEHIADYLGGLPTAGVNDLDARRIVRDLGPVSSIVPPAPRPVFVTNPPQPVAEPEGRTGYAAAGCGVAGLVLIPLIPVSVVFGLMALLLGFLALRRRQQRGFAVAGLVMGLIAGVVIPVTFIGLFTATDDGGSTSVTSYPASVPYNAP